MVAPQHSPTGVSNVEHAVTEGDSTAWAAQDIRLSVSHTALLDKPEITDFIQKTQCLAQQNL
ncbi:hypothetical protein [Pseudomonas sp. Irchel 3E13]|jgi:hypothetical protein|uniref:hypothetical protein n=1 Tax=Pseudomonas sp. Irchel 3E13 TaxID=2008975 RepID=UPI00117AC717|nr:hypothetical protein [Pseudomonas sp. Irchel 3E13]